MEDLCPSQSPKTFLTLSDSHLLLIQKFKTNFHIVILLPRSLLLQSNPCIEEKNTDYKHLGFLSAHLPLIHSVIAPSLTAMLVGMVLHSVAIVPRVAL